ncbi:hypothetical protein BU24DRAFT_428620 [Aaosphaeria arxii CBS 175.79]|uniref:Uncharacterized protein n=1 Tax=Aaosphaeria arxii CBS 175.79 TaxID=1450172 RepID=A0A6A5X9Z5_9PLEO|nr:uncharacterized protein BU24DRAFT_428620 [Aaosphaeria arxii CBS 175.79]KAF2009740.1 hypothetical protein BU24DRAFT_428620 [Aaosphaeria arxii CBS 175.79]
MLDENLPTFFLKASPGGIKHNESYYFTQHGSEPEATYSLKHLDPASNEAKNTYAAALFDAHNPDILYSEVLAKPGWTQPSLSQEEIRRNGGVPPPPQPIFPTEFAVQLYNPDMQIIVRQQTSKWSSTVTYEFNMPQTTFRTPSSSSLDRSQDDPGADSTTPKINFVWRKEGRFGKDLTCYMTGKTTDPTGKKAKKSKEPDIVVALFSGLRELTIMETNLYRVEMEDYKGLEVVLLLGAAVIRDLFFSNTRETFNIIDPNSRKNSGPLRGRKGSSPLQPGNTIPPVMTPRPQAPPQQPPRLQQPMQSEKAALANGLYNNQPSPNAAKRTSLPPLQTGRQPTSPPSTQPAKRLDPRAQWEIDAETARLKAQVEAEAREQKRQEEVNRRARRKAEEEEARKTRKFLEQEERQRQLEEKERRRKQAEVDKETERLRKQFGDQSSLLPPTRPQQTQRHSTPSMQAPAGSWQTARPAHPPRPAAAHGPYLQPPGLAQRPAASQSSFFHSSSLRPADAQAKMKKKSFWGLRSSSENSTSTLKKKQSSMF